MSERATEQVYWTTDDLDRLSYDELNRYEIIDGELLVSPAPHPYHQLTSSRIWLALHNWSKTSGVGQSLEACRIRFTKKDEVIPDVLWISYERKARLLKMVGYFAGAPELLVEVLSPGRQNEKRDREYKRELYELYGVEEYWIADWQSQEVEVYRWEQDQLRLVATLGIEDTLTTPLLPGFACRLDEIFGEE